MNTTLVLGTCAAIMTANCAVVYSIYQSQQETNRVIVGEIGRIKEDVSKMKEVVMYTTSASLRLSAADEECLARNVFHEAGVETYAGKIAVAQTTINRVASGRWGNNVCSVVYAKAQFSWTLNKKKRHQTPKGPLWNASIQAVKDFKQGVRIKDLESTQFYHADYIRTPKWANSSKQVHKIGQHIFYNS